MARRPRLVVPEIALHIVQRGVDRQACFFSDSDREFYLAVLAALAHDHGCSIHAFVLMTNHVHLLLTPEREAGPAELLQAIGRRYVRHVNDSYRRTGTLWEGRFRSCLVGEDGYAIACHRYIELNPVRARMVARADDYPWSSHRANAGADEIGWLTAHPAMLGLGSTPTERQTAYRQLFADAPDATQTDAIRRATQGNYALGSPRFAEQIASMLGRRVAPGSPGRPRRERGRVEMAH